jgi:hypothetical protein
VALSKICPPGDRVAHHFRIRFVPETGAKSPSSSAQRQRRQGAGIKVQMFALSRVQHMVSRLHLSHVPVIITDGAIADRL